MKYCIKVFSFIIVLISIFYIFILSVDPYDKYNFNYWNLKTKAVNSFRDNKFYQIDNSLEKYNLFILGSSRVQVFDPDLITKYTGFKVFNYGVNNAKPEDLLAITKHIISKQIPQVIFLQLDFYSLNEYIPFDSRLQTSPLRDYLNSKVKDEISNNKFYFYEKNYMTLSALKDTINLIYRNKFGVVNKTHKRNGMKILSEAKENPPLAVAYFKNEYKTYKFSTTRIEYLRKLKQQCDINNIKLVVSISPMNKEHFLKLISDNHLYEQIFNFKKVIVDIFGEVYDFNNLSTFEYAYPYWNNSVHPSIKLSNLMIEVIFSKGFLNLNRNFGVLLNRDNINNYLMILKNKIESMK